MAEHQPPKLTIWIHLLVILGCLSIIGGAISVTVFAKQGFWLGVACSVAGTVMTTVPLFAGAAAIDAIGVIAERQERG